MVSYFDTFKYTKQIRQIFAEQFENPNEEFVKFFGKQVYDGVFTQSIKEQFTELTRRAFPQFVNERFDLPRKLRPNIKLKTRRMTPRKNRSPSPTN